MLVKLATVEFEMLRDGTLLMREFNAIAYSFRICCHFTIEIEKAELKYLNDFGSFDCHFYSAP